jgi:hypothetical protein
MIDSPSGVGQWGPGFFQCDMSRGFGLDLHCALTDGQNIKNDFYLAWVPGAIPLIKSPDD